MVSLVGKEESKNTLLMLLLKNAIKYNEILLGEAVPLCSLVCRLGHLACVLGDFRD